MKLLQSSLVASAFAAVLICSCASPLVTREDRFAAAQLLEGAFDELEASRVDVFENDGCRALSIDGQFVTDTQDGAPCHLAEGEPAKPFDPAAEEAFGRVASAIRATGVAVQYGWFSYGNDGVLERAMFEVGCQLPCEFARFLYRRSGVIDVGDAIGPGIVNERLSAQWLWHTEGED